MLRRAATSLRLRVADAMDPALGRSDLLIPPRRLRFVGNSDFRETGEEFRAHFHRFAELSRGDRVLDIGCGIGRMARVLAGELSPPHGSYDGFDVARQGIEWCRGHYQGTPVPFRFTHVDLHHAEYNPDGRGGSECFRFPYADDSFDLAIAVSLFTHLLDPQVERYMSETARVLAPGGRLFSTWFVLDQNRLPDPERAMTTFQATTRAAHVVDPSRPEDAVAYTAGWIRDCLERQGLAMREPYQQGSWTGRHGPSSQDIVVADLTRSAHPR